MIGEWGIFMGISGLPKTKPKMRSFRFSVEGDLSTLGIVSESRK